jgi:hypothetical protein
MSKPEYTYCEHGRVRELVVCRQCCESALKMTLQCVEVQKKAKRALVDARVPCEHCSERRRCKICKGAWICAHGLNKVYCRECDGRRLCQGCHGTTLPRCWELCKECKSAIKEREAASRERKRARCERAGLGV